MNFLLLCFRIYYLRNYSGDKSPFNKWYQKLAQTSLFQPVQKVRLGQNKTKKPAWSENGILAVGCNFIFSFTIIGMKYVFTSFDPLKFEPWTFLILLTAFKM